MNNAEAKEILDHNWTKLVNPDYSDEELGEAQNLAIKALSVEPQEWVTVNSPEDYPKESGDYLTVLKDTGFHDFEYTDITSFDCDGILAKWDLKPQYKVVAWKYFEPYKADKGEE